MDNILFYKSFAFRTLQLKQAHHTDNSAGIPHHFIARLRQGSVRFVSLSGEVMELTRGAIFYLPLGLQYHSYWTPDTEGDSIAEWESYGFQTFPNLTNTRYKMQILYPDENAVSYLERLYRDQTVTPSSVGWLYLFLGSVLPFMKEENPDPQARLLAKAKEYIASHQDFKVGALARHCNMSESGIYAFFREYAGTTPIEMKHRMQVEQAIQWLATTDLSIEEISDQLKFSSAAYFRKIVKEQTGKTPSQLRREHSLTDRL